MSTLNVGIIGCGHIAETMVRTIRKTRGFRAWAAASRNLDKAVGFAKRHHVKKAYGSYEELVQDRKVDLVYIATPHSEHYANARLCLENGKPCLVEKAFTVSQAQARELFRLSETKNVFITEAIWTRYMPFLRTMREVITSGVIGEPVMLSANLGYAVKQKERLTSPDLAGGTLLDLGVYPINLASMLFGDDLLRVEISGTYTSRHLDEQENITLVYRDGRIAVLSASMLGATDRRCVVSGTRGYVVIDNINNFEGMTVYGADHRKIATYRRPRQKTGYEYELRACRAALENGWIECPQMPHGETLFMLRIMDELRSQMGIVYPMEQEKPAPQDPEGATRQDLGASPGGESPAEDAAAAGPTEQEAGERAFAAGPEPIPDQEPADGLSGDGDLQGSEEPPGGEPMSAAAEETEPIPCGVPENPEEVTARRTEEGKEGTPEAAAAEGTPDAAAFRPGVE